MKNEEIVLDDKDLIVSMTDTEGVITYVNDIFCGIAGYSRKDLIGKSHNIIRHPDMPKMMFKFLWQQLKEGKSLYMIVKNRTVDGGYYWVNAYVKPLKNNKGVIDKYVSYRRKVSQFAIDEISKLYKKLTVYEDGHTVDDSFEYFMKYLEERNLTYEHFVKRLLLGKSCDDANAMKIEYEKYYYDHVIFRAHIEQNVALGNYDVEVTDSCCCTFGQWCKMVEYESFIEHPAWKRVQNHHNHVHIKLKDYVQAAKNEESQEKLKAKLSEIEQDTKLIFSNLQDVIDNK